MIKKFLLYLIIAPVLVMMTATDVWASPQRAKAKYTYNVCGNHEWPYPMNMRFYLEEYKISDNNVYKAQTVPANSTICVSLPSDSKIPYVLVLPDFPGKYDDGTNGIMGLTIADTCHKRVTGSNLFARRGERKFTVTVHIPNATRYGDYFVNCSYKIE